MKVELDGEVIEAEGTTPEEAVTWVCKHATDMLDEHPDGDATADNGPIVVTCEGEEWWIWREVTPVSDSVLRQRPRGYVPGSLHTRTYRPQKARDIFAGK